MSTPDIHPLESFVINAFKRRAALNESVLGRLLAGDVPRPGFRNYRLVERMCSNSWNPGAG